MVPEYEMSATFDTTYNTGTGAAAAPAPQLAAAPQVMTCSEFARQMLGFQPDEMQCQILDSTAPQGLLNCCRQWGKSTVMAIKAIYHARTTPIPP